MAVSAGTYYIVGMYKIAIGYSKTHDEIFINEDSAIKFKDSLPEGWRGFVQEVKVNYS